MFVPTTVEHDIFIAHHQTMLGMEPYLRHETHLAFKLYLPKTFSIVPVQSTESDFNYTFRKQLIFMVDSGACMMHFASSDMKYVRAAMIRAFAIVLQSRQRPAHDMFRWPWREQVWSERRDAMWRRRAAGLVDHGHVCARR
jgi:hypothetical protein